MKIKQLVWHDIKTVDAAKTARLPALVFSIFGTVLWAFITFATLLGHKSTAGYWVFLYFPFFGAISYGLFKMRREAAIAYLVVSILDVISWGHTARLVSAIAGIFVATLAVRGTFSYSRLQGENDKQTYASNQRSDHDQA